MKPFIAATAILVAVCAASSAHAQDLNTLTAQFKGDAEEADRQMTYGENNANNGDDYSACLNARNAIADYEDAVTTLKAMADLVSTMTNLTDDQRKEFTDANTQAQDDFTDRLNTAHVSASEVCYGN